MPAPERGNGTLSYRVDRLEETQREQDARQERLNDKLDKLVLAIVGAALTLAVSVTVFAVTMLVSGGK